MTFELHPKLITKPFIIDLQLCRVLMQDEKNYPWLFLVPRKANVSKIIDLSLDDQLQLTRELDLVQRFMWEEFKPSQINVAALGNKLPQLHLHVIARREGDPAWPNTVWDHPLREKYDPEVKQGMIEKFKAGLESWIP